MTEYPKVCPKCGKVLDKHIEELKKGGFIYIEVCPDNSVHYHHLREPTYQECMEFNT